MPSAGDTLTVLDDATRALVRLSAVVTAGTDDSIRDAIARAVQVIPPVHVEELLLQSYLFAGFPRALNAMREWRRLVPTPPEGTTARDDGEHIQSDRSELATWRHDGEVTCAAVYGAMYERLRHNIRGLHPRLDDWMITEGYGKVLSRPGLDLGRRELCIVAACAAARQDRQLLSHLHGALNVGVAADVIGAALAALADLLGPGHTRSVELLWARVRGK
ncbi:MAG TPA: carboxymuconolactone decarboxylase family protein [Gemmatimonadaceae bacterium]|nr:carboxymuconolactone decarboxylase family protein [Gemmatimonadaceae bacterium]